MIWTGFLGLGLGIAVSLVLLWRTRQEILRTKELVETVNGRSLAILAELGEGRRIRTDIPVGERTTREQAYVDLLEQTEAQGTEHEVAEDVDLAARGEDVQGPRQEKEEP